MFLITTLYTPLLRALRTWIFHTLFTDLLQGLAVISFCNLHLPLLEVIGEERMKHHFLGVLLEGYP